MSEHSGAAPWRREVGATQWRSLAAAGAGWMLDAMDVTLYVIALGSIREEFGLTNAQAGAVASVTLIASAVGGVASGVLADRFGRVRMLTWSILTYSVFTALTATSQSVAQLVIWRLLVGLGMGGEWSAGAVLVAETWPAKHRGTAIGLMQSGWALGYILAAVIGAVVLPRWGWRVLFLIGFAPALLTLWVRRHVPEPAVWREGGVAASREVGGWASLLRAPLRSRVIVATAMTASLLFSYWGLFTWVPKYLAGADHGGAGLGIVRSTAWIVAMQIGAFFGYTSFGFLADRFGRRPTFIAFVLGAAGIVPVYGASARSGTALMILGPIVGFLGHGYFSVFGAMLAELFPSGVRGTAQGFCYNAGRAVSALAPWTIGWVADRQGFALALGCTSVCYVVGAALVLLLPETRGREIV
ncbi:MAG: MFS transporter [Phycisphaerae bacterium]|nr:MFS transporter [Phycisphaerae bacterium]